MRSLLFRFGLTTAAVAIAVSPALAQKPGESGGSPAADRPVAVERPAAGSGDSGARSSAPAASSSSGSAAASTTSTSSPSATSIPTMGFGGSRSAYREEAPQHRTSAGSASSGQAVPRGAAGSSASGSSSSSSSGAKSSTPARQQSGENRADGSQAVPDWARPRGGQPATGTAVGRTTPRPHDDHGNYYNGYYYNPFGYYYGPSGYYYGNYFYGGAYYSPYYYAPFTFSPYIYSPYMLGYGFGLGFPWGVDPSYGAGYGSQDDYWYSGGGGNYSSSQPAHDQEQGGLRLKVKPRDAKVYIDGYFVGTVDTMDGVFQKLPLNSGRHHVSVKADGYQPEEFDVVITPNETATYQGDLKKSKL